MKQALIIRAHSIKKPLIDLINKSQEQNFPVFLAVDETNCEFPDTLAPKISLTFQKLKSLSLPQVSNCFWLMGDYAFYICRPEVRDFDFYWMIEQDVCVNFDKMQNFFDLFAGSDDDLLAPELEMIEPGWWTWTETMHPFVGQTWRCFFPVTRLSGRAIDYLHHRRISTFNYIEAKRGKTGIQLPTPNDEAFVSSELCEAGFACKDLNYYKKDLYSRDTFRFRKPIPQSLLRQVGSDSRIYHPVIDDSELIHTLMRRFQFLGHRGDIEKLRSETDYGSFGKLRDIIEIYFGARAAQYLEAECHLLAEAWS